MKKTDLSSSIAVEMDKVLNSDENKKLFSDSSVLEKLAFKKVSEDDKTTEVEVELENVLQKTASIDSPETPEVSEENVIDMLLQASEDLDTLGFDKLSVYSAKLADQLIVEAKAKSKKSKDDPKAKVRNRGKCVFPAGSSKVKDNEDHYPINNESEALAALRYAGKQKSAPWYKGTVEEMRKAVERAVHKAFPSIGKKSKKTKSSK